jgi:ribosomal protein L21E
MKKLLLSLFIFAGGAVAQEFPFPQDTIAYNDLFNNRQSVMFDSEGRVHVAYSGQTGTMSQTKEIYYVVQTSDTLIRRQVTANAVDDNYPTVVVDRDDNVHIGFLGRDAGNLFQVQYTRLVNGVFTSPIFVTTGGLNKATPYCAVGPDSVVHFVYFTFTTGPDAAYYRRFDPRDSSLSDEIPLIGAEVTGDLDASIAADSAGFVHIVVKSGDASGGPLRYYTNRTGNLIESPTGVSVDVDYPRLLVDHNDIVHILYRNSPTERLYIINNATGSFGTPVALTPPGQRPATYHNFAVDDENRVYVVYQSSLAGSGRGFYLVHEKNGEVSDTMLVWDITPSYLLRNTSAVAARGNGEIAVLYAPSASRNSVVVCDIFMQRGFLFGPPAPAIQINKDTLTLTAATAWRDSLVVRNSGTAALTVESILLYSSDPITYNATIEPSSFTVAPRDSEIVRVYLTALTAAPNFDFSDSLLIFSDDPKNPVRIVLLQGDYLTNIGEEGHLRRSFRLHRNFPNPFNPSTSIRYELPAASDVTIRVFDILGREVETIVNEVKQAGYHEVVWSAGLFPSGAYFYRLQAGSFVSAHKMILLK